MANHNAVRAGRAYVEIFADAAKFQQQLRQTESEFRNWGQQMSAIGSSVAASFSMLPIAAAVNNYIKFDDAMRSVAAATGRSLKEIGVSNDELAKRLNVSISDMRRGQFEMEALAKKARQLGQSLSYTSAEVADAMVVLARAGQNVGEIGHTVEAVLDMARATGTEVASAAQFVVGALHEFQLEATQTRRVVDLMTRTANASPQSLEDLGNALKYIGPVAHSMSLEIEEVMRDLGLLARFNIRGEQAGTSMRNLYMRMTSELNQRKFKETFKVDLIDKETGAVRSLLDVLSETRKNIESLGLAKSEVADAFKQVFSLRALPAAFSLTEVVDRAHEMEIALSNARSEAYNARKVMDGGLGGAFRALKSDAQEAGHSLVESIEEPLIEIVRSIENAIEKIDSFIDRNRMMIGGLLKYGSIAGGAALTLGALAVAAGAASKSFSGLLGVTRNFNKTAFDRFAGWSRQLTGRESIVKPEPKEPKINLRPIDEARTSVKALDEKLTDVARITSRAIVRFNNLAKGFYNVASKGQTAANSLSKLSTSVGLSFEHLRKFNSEFLKSKKAYGDARVKISALSRVVQTSSTRFSKASSALQKFGERNDYVGERVATLEKTLLSFQQKTSGVQDSVKKISAAFRTAATEIGQASANYKSTATRLSQSLSVIASNLNRVVGRLNSGTRSFANFQNAAEKLAASIKTSSSIYQTVEQAVDKFRERVRLASADVRDARRALDDAQKSLNAFGKTSGSNGVKTFAASLATASQAIQTIIGTSEQLVGALHASGEAFAFAAANAVLYRDALAKIVQYNKALIDDTQGQKKKQNKKKNDDNDPPGGGGGGGRGTPTRTDRVIEKADEFIKDRDREEDVVRKDSVPVSRAEIQRKFGKRVARRVEAKYVKRERKISERADKILATKRARDQALNELANLEARQIVPGLNDEQRAKLASEIKNVKARIAGYNNTIKQLQEARRNANAKSNVVSTNASRDAAERSLWDKYLGGPSPSRRGIDYAAASRSRRKQKQIDDANRRGRSIDKSYVGKLGDEFSRAANEAQKFTSANLKLQPAIQSEIQALRKSATLKIVSRNVDARLLDITQRLLVARQEEQAAQQTYRQNESKRSPLDAARSARLNELGGGIQSALSRIPATAALMKEPLEKWVEKHRGSLQKIRRLEAWVERLSKNQNVDNKVREQAQRRLDAAKTYHRDVVLGESKSNLFSKWLAPHLEARSDLKRLSAERNAFATSTRGDLEQRRTERASDLGRLNTARNNTLALEGELAQALGNRAAIQQATATAERELASATANRVAALNAANVVSNGALGTFSGTPTVDQLQTLASESQDRQRAFVHESYLKGQTLVSENNRLFPETPWRYEGGKVVPATPYAPSSNPPTPPNNPPTTPNSPLNRPVVDVTKGFDVAWKSTQKKLAKVGKLSFRDFNQLSELWSASGRAGTFGQFLKEGKTWQKKQKELDDKRLTSKGNWNLYNLHRTQYEESEQKRYALQNKIDATKAPILRQAEEMRANGASDKAVRAYLQGQFAALGELKSLNKELSATQQASNAALVAMDSAKQKAQKFDKKHGIVSENAGRARSEGARAERSLENADRMQAELRDEEREINRNRDETKSSISDKKNKISGYDSSIAELDKKLERFQDQKLDEKDKKERDELKRQRDAMEANRNVLQQELEADKQKLTSLDEDKKRLNQRQQDVGLIQQRNQERLLKARGLGKEFGLDGVDDPKKAQARKDFAEANVQKKAAKKEWSETFKQWGGPDSKFQKGWKAFSSGLTGVVKGLAGLRTATGRAIAMENAKAGFYRLTLMGLRGLAVASVKAAAGLIGIAAMSLMGVAIGLVTQALFKFGEWLTKWWKDDPKAHDEEFKAKQDEALQKRDEEVNKQTSREEHVRALEELSKQDYLTEENRKEASNRLIELQKNSTGDVNDFARLEKVKGKDGKESWKLKFDDYKAQSFLSEESKKVDKESENALQTIADGLGNKNVNKNLKTHEDTVVNEQKKEESQQIQEERIASARALIMQIKEEGGTISKDFAKKFRNQITESSDYLTFNGTAKFSKTSTSPNGIGTTNWEETTFATTEGSGIASEMLALADEIDALASDDTKKIFKAKFIEDGLATKRDDFAAWKGRIESGDLDAEGLTDSYNNYIDFINRGIANASRALDEGVGNAGDVNKIQDELKTEIENVDKAYAQYRKDMGRKIDSERINRKSKNILKVYDEQKARLETARKERELIANDYGAGQFAEARAAAGSDKKKIEEIDKAEAAAKAEAKRLADARYQERADEINEDIKLETDKLLLSIYSEFDAGYGAQAKQAALAARTKKQSVDGWVLGNVAAYDAETENLRQRQKDLQNKKDASQEDKAEIEELELQITKRTDARSDYVKRYEDEGETRKKEIDARAARDFEKLQERQFAGRFTDAERQMQTLIDNLDKDSDTLADAKTYIAGLEDKTAAEREAMEKEVAEQAQKERAALMFNHELQQRQLLTSHESGQLRQFIVDDEGIELARRQRERQLQGMIDAEQAIINKFGADSEEGKAALEQIEEMKLFKKMADEFYEFKKEMEKAEKKLSLDRFMAEMGTETGELEGVSEHEFDAKKKNLEIDKQAKAANYELDRQIEEAEAKHTRLLESGDVDAANEKAKELQQLQQHKNNLNSNVERVKKQNLADAESKGTREMFEKDKRKQDSVVFGSEIRSSQADIQIAAIESMKTGGMFEEYDKMVDRQANRVRYSKAVSDYESAQSRAGVLNSQAQEAYKIWQDSIKNGASSDEVQENFEKYKSLWQESNSAQKGLQEALGSARQARLGVIKGEFKRKESFSTGTFSAFEAMDAHNDWQKENAVKQTEFLKKICENTELGLWS